MSAKRVKSCRKASKVPRRKKKTRKAAPVVAQQNDESKTVAPAKVAAPMIVPPRHPSSETHVVIPKAQCKQCKTPAPLLELLGIQYGMSMPIDISKSLLCNHCRQLNERIRSYVQPQVLSQMQVV